VIIFESDIHFEDEIADADAAWEAECDDARCGPCCTEHVHPERWVR
jgi:hypothetical protein